MKKFSIILWVLLLSACGDFPSYRYEQSENYCVLNFPFAGGLFDRKYIGYFNITSTLQFLDADPEYEIFIGEPSGIQLEVGSVIKVEIGDKVYMPTFHKTYVQGELQYWGPAFTFTKAQSTEIYNSLQEGNDLTIYGRLEVGKPYETEIYNFFFDSDDRPFRSCINQLLDEEDLAAITEQKSAPKKMEASDSE
jgi:hypothetical protein